VPPTREAAFAYLDRVKREALAERGIATVEEATDAREEAEPEGAS
jgi:hypothetical protein